MTRRLSIRSDKAYRLAHALAALTGESLTDAVTTSLRERLAHERHVSGKEAKLRDILALAAHIREKTGGAIMSEEELDAFLYDPETGLPH